MHYGARVHTVRSCRCSSCPPFQPVTFFYNRIATLGGSASPLALGVQAIANDMQARTTGIIETTTANTHRLDSLASAVSTAQATVATVPSTLAATVNTMTNAMDAQVNTMNNTMNARIRTVLGSLASTATALTAAQEAGASTLTASVGTQLTRVNTSIRAVNVALAGKRSAAQHVWIGSCSSNQDGGWREYCFDRPLVDSARPMFRKENNNRMRSIQAGCKDADTDMTFRATCACAATLHHGMSTHCTTPTFHAGDLVPRYVTCPMHSSDSSQSASEGAEFHPCPTPKR